ncbi:hypothetical protein C8Q76DRAFT_761656 [Earliella scabrosa]|nr:hypothetical protein C8Q76DRAFT_761656 [Earliella scabrosa]
MSRWIGYTPDMWASGGEPMTNKQLRYFFVLCREAGRRIEQGSVAGQKITKAEASIVLTMYENHERVSMEYIDTLGRGPEPDVLTHPTTWVHCHDEMSGVQRMWIDDLLDSLRVPPAASKKGTLGLTLGQAAYLIHILRMEKGKLVQQRKDGRWLDNAVTLAMEEVPLPDEIDDEDYKSEESSDGEESEMDEMDEDAEEEEAYERMDVDLTEEVKELEQEVAEVKMKTA